MNKTPLAMLWFLLISAAGCATPLSAVEHNKDVARRAFAEVIETGRLDATNELYAAQFRNGKANLQQDMAALRAWHSVLPPDTTIRPELVLGEGEYVAVLWTARATDRDRLLTGRGITIWRFENGKIREEWSEFDQERWMRLLGLKTLGDESKR
ncbi:MAG TPA: nuclear transport factor 2 family protein [Anaeromyxobacter sp.]|nr:nuclear transport factor 2 family protein [Anaeromyxobacter sp.]